jgi:hypothetical protein
MKKYWFKKLKTIVCIVFIFCISSYQSIHSQIHVGVGVDGIKGFTVRNPYTGMSLLLEKQEDVHSIYARFCSTLSKNEEQEYLIDDTIKGNLTYRYNTLEIGRRKFYGKDLEYGFGFYTAEHVTISYNRVGINLLNSPSNYSLPSSIHPSGNILSFAIGANAGIQFAFVRGIVFAEIGFNYSLTGGMPNNETAQKSGSYSGITFTGSIGVKKTLNFGY